MRKSILLLLIIITSLTCCRTQHDVITDTIIVHDTITHVEHHTDTFLRTDTFTHHEKVVIRELDSVSMASYGITIPTSTQKAWLIQQDTDNRQVSLRYTASADSTTHSAISSTDSQKVITPAPPSKNRRARDFVICFIVVVFVLAVVARIFRDRILK